MEDWKFAQKDPSECLAKLHFYSVTKKHACGEIEARITVKEFATCKTSDLKFYASADIELNQKTVPFKPFGKVNCGLSPGAVAICAPAKLGQNSGTSGVNFS